MLILNLRASDIYNFRDRNETTVRLNRNLWNHLTISAEEQTEINVTRRFKRTDLIETFDLWNKWIISLPGMSLFFLNLFSPEYLRLCE